MNVDLSGKFPCGVTVAVKLNNEEKEVNREHPKVSFSLTEGKRYDVEIIQKESGTDFSKAYILFLILTFIFRGIFFFIMLMGSRDELEDYFHELHPYCVRGTFSIKAETDIDIHMKVIKSVYNEKEKTWKLPVLQITPNLGMEVSYIVNESEVKALFLRSVKNLLSAGMILEIIFGVLLHVFWSGGFVYGAEASVILIAAVPLLILFRLKYDYKKICQLRNGLVEVSKYEE